MKLKQMMIGVAGLLCMTACGDMDFAEYTNYGEDYVKLNFDNVGALLTPIYNALDNDFGNYSGAMLASACDESQYAYTSNTINQFYNGAWGPSNAMSSIWSTNYTAIANCNVFLNEFVGLTFDDLAENSDYDTQMLRYQNYPYEVRALRAYFYMNLARQYGAVPMPDPETVLDVDQANTCERTPAQDVFDYVISECEAIQDLIVEDYTSGTLSAYTETGRINKKGVLAIKATAALYAASPLFNEDNDASLWTRAANYTKELLDQCEADGMYLVDDYASLWDTGAQYDATTIHEIIFDRRSYSASSAIESYNYPVGITSGSGGNCPTQNLVDAYDMVETGEPYAGGWTSTADPYTGRDPRFELTIAHNGTEAWPKWNDATLETFYNGTNGQPTSGGTPTSYYLKKLLHGDMSFEANTSTSATRHTWITFRLGEFYLNMAECIYKVTGSPYTAWNGSTANEMLNMTRTRAGMPEIPTGLSNDAWWEKYERERMVELAFEGHRFWDLRRWKEGEKCTEGVYGMSITRNYNGSDYVYTYTKTLMDRNSWDDKWYLFPIPTEEIQKNPNLTQNPGW